MAPRAASTRAKLVEATTHVVAEVGYARATTKAIAEAAGVAEGTIYRHFPDKQQLFFAAFHERNAAVVAEVARLPGLAGTATVKENLGVVLARLAGLRSEVLPLELSLMADPELRRSHQEAMATLPSGEFFDPRAVFMTYLGAEQDLGRIRADVDLARAAVVLLATLFGAGLMPGSEDPATLRALVAAAADLMVDGLCPPPRPTLSP